MTFVDTNYFLRFLLNDINEQHLEAKKLFTQGANGEEELCTSVVVFMELYWVLTSFYQMKKNEVADVLSKVLALTFIEFENKNLLVKALHLHKDASLELEDCYNIEYAKTNKCTAFATFDRKAKKAFK